jgi:hypothetical protein
MILGIQWKNKWVSSFRISVRLVSQLMCTAGIVLLWTESEKKVVGVKVLQRCLGYSNTRCYKCLVGGEVGCSKV